jgi:hypothetical protein
VGNEDVPLATVVQVDEPAPPPVGDADANTGTNAGTNTGTNNDEAAGSGDNGEG